MLASLAGQAGTAALEADRAIALLRKAVAQGFRRAETFRTEPALDLLRGRPDFGLLMMDLAMPADPFAH